MYEVEVKARLRNREEVKKKLTELGCAFSEEFRQVDEIFTLTNLEFPPPKGTPVLRIRNQNNKYIFTLKINQSSRQDCIEREMEITNPESWRDVFELMGYKLNVVVDKTRIKTNYKDMEIVLDNVKDLGEFAEAEKITEQNDPEERKEIQEELFSFLETIGIQKEDRVIDGKYDIMLIEKLKTQGNPV